MITEENFNEFFFPVKDHPPKPGQILARWHIQAEFIDGMIKRNVIDLLLNNKAGAETARAIMINLIGTPEIDAVLTLLSIALDLQILSADTVAKKPYSMLVEKFYWVAQNHVPNDENWEMILCENPAKA